ncbi:histone-lysine N-methyltransferase, H3 lysine-79 specific-like [Contarinia nasturtii]|uniref:histone-lysine N-methyltransferase, H3 lysine-79 specific-like n=1 Tax=Contarinia nasturtii TaxID=265458 RepID=UPI0012D4853E|nr:histone-lysine N-methyltransferase, H3 lysine-79 specific-like [Contarinia nasturtii]XP_031616861.1 histone-lysine N-methyltransferase, H3 lysine-79 specific-like [Contarinia nasturtii]
MKSSRKNLVSHEVEVVPRAPIKVEEDEGDDSYMFTEPVLTSATPRLILKSPAYVEPMYYSWPLQTGPDDSVEILDVIRWVCKDIPYIEAELKTIDLNEVDTTCYNSMRHVCDSYNKAIDTMANIEKRVRELTAKRLNDFASRDLLRYILQLVYYTAVPEPNKLNKYESFSPGVYGETSFEVVCQMIDLIEASPEDVFIDLGSGVGQVVLQMSAALPLKSCLGIERADVPSKYAVEMDFTFRRWMRWFGKKLNDFQLIKGDFLADEHRDKITTATIVFVNNFAFGAKVDHDLKERFGDLSDGTKIFSSKNFCKLNFRLNERNLSDIGAIMNVKKLPSLRESVSWTDKPVSYYLHIIDRTKLNRFFEQKNDQNADENDSHIRNNRNINGNTNNQVVTSEDINVSTGSIKRNPRNCSRNLKYNVSADEEDQEQIQHDLKKRKRMSNKSALTDRTNSTSGTSNAKTLTISNAVTTSISNTMTLSPSNTETPSPSNTATPPKKIGESSKLAGRKAFAPAHDFTPSPVKRVKTSSVCPNPLALALNVANDHELNVDWLIASEQSAKKHLNDAMQNITNFNARSFEMIIKLNQKLNAAMKRIDILEQQKEIQQLQIADLQHELDEKSGKAACLECGNIINMMTYCNPECHEKQIIKRLGQMLNKNGL